MSTAHDQTSETSAFHKNVSIPESLNYIILKLTNNNNNTCNEEFEVLIFAQFWKLLQVVSLHINVYCI